MKITKEQFNKAQKTFSKKSLSGTQKHAMLSSIYSEKNVSERSVISPLSSYFIFFRQKAFVAAVVVVLLLSGTSYVSAHSLPGDLLYPIKTNIIESIGLALRFNEEAKNEYRIYLLKKRVDELEELKQRGEISEDSRQDSSKATNKTAKNLEGSAIFDEEGENDYVSEKMKIYNNLIDAELEIETTIKIDTDINMDTEIKENNKLEVKVEEDILDIEDEVGGIDTEEDINPDTNNNLPPNTNVGSEIEIEIPRL